MSLQDFIASLDALHTDALGAFESASDAESLEAARVTFTGAKKGRLRDIQKQMGGVPKEGKKDAGMKFNEVKKAIDAALTSAQERLGGGDDDGSDPTLTQLCRVTVRPLDTFTRSRKPSTT